VYVAVIEREPFGRFFTVMVAVPPLSVAVPSGGPAPSLRVMVPVGAVVPLLAGVTTTVNVIGLPVKADALSATTTGARATVSLSGRDVRAPKLSSPPYWAMIDAVPTGSALLEKLATPSSSVALPSAVVPARNVTVPFSDLAQYGITFDTLSPTQQAAITSRGGPASATVVLTQQVNASGRLIVDGLEGTWVQSLDFLLGRYLGINGFGFSVNGTIIDQRATGTGAPAIAVGVSPHTYNATFYYERHGISARLSTTWAEGNQTTLPNQNGITNAALFANDYQQWDFSSSLDLSTIFGSRHLPQLTFDVVNIFKEVQRSYFQFPNAAFTSYQPGRTVLIGLRGRF
jgi:hypothetical protein